MASSQMTFNAFVKNILDNTIPFDLFNFEEMTTRETKYMDWITDNGEHLKYYVTDDFLEIYMEYFDLRENQILADYDEAMEMNAEYIDQVELEKGLDIDDMVKDMKTFGYSDFMYNMSYDAW
jgi:hypothetical protein